MKNNIILRAQYCFPSIALSNVALRNEISGYFFLTVKKKKKENSGKQLFKICWLLRR